MTTTTEFGTWANHDSYVSVEDTVTTFLGDYVQDYDVDGLVSAFRAAINAALPQEISLLGDQFYGPYPMPADASDVIDAAIASVDLGQLAAEYDRS